MNLKNGLGMPSSEFKIPTLCEAMLAAKGKIMVNLDKADRYSAEVYEILQETGTVDQTIIKSNKPYEQLRAIHGEHLDKMVFMPVIDLNKLNNRDSLTQIFNMDYVAYELVFKTEDRSLLDFVKIQLRNRSRIWINSLWPSLCAGYSDDKALRDPDAIYGYLIDSLDTRIIQTDRPAYLLEYLSKK